MRHIQRAVRAFSGFLFSAFAVFFMNTLRDNIPESDLEKIAEISAGPGIAMFSPKKVTKEDVLKMLKEAYYR